MLQYYSQDGLRSHSDFLIMSVYVRLQRYDKPIFRDCILSLRLSGNKGLLSGFVLLALMFYSKVRYKNSV